MEGILYGNPRSETPSGGWLSTARHPASRIPPGETGFTPLFNGKSTENWEMVGAGGFVAIDGRLESVPGADVGLFWCRMPTPTDFVLRLDWLRWRHEDVSGVVVRMPRPRRGADARAAVAAVQRGFKVQIDEVGPPGGAAIHRTGAIFGEAEQVLRPQPALPPAEWNEFEIAVEGQHYCVRLNGEPVSSFVNVDLARGRASRRGLPTFIGLQVCPLARVAFRRIRLRAL